MKLDVRDRAMTVAMAEAACLQAQIGRVDAVREVKREFLRVATPLRIVGSGFAVGIAAGLLPTRTKTTTTGPLSHLFGLAMDTILPSLMAGMAAAQAAGEEVEEVADELADEVSEQVVDDIAGDVVVEEPVRVRRPRS